MFLGKDNAMRYAEKVWIFTTDYYIADFLQFPLKGGLRE